MRNGGNRRVKRRTRAPARRRGDIDLGPLPGLIGYMLRRAQITVFQDIFRAFSTVDIRPAQFLVLTIIEHNPGRTQSQVSAALRIKRTNFVALFDSLESRGLAVRRPAPSDRRSHALHLTAAGKAVMRRLKQMVDKLEAGMVARIGADGREELLKLLHRLAEGPHRAADARPLRRRRTAAKSRRRQAAPKRSLTSEGTG
jgi:DNA-binding MarR family transcriptional regulator